jgi:hypothetical protein
VSIAQLAILIPSVLLLIVGAGLLLRHFRGVSVKWWVIRSLVAIAPVAVGFSLVYSLRVWNRDGLLLISVVALIATLLNWRVARGVADQYALEFEDMNASDDR